MAVKISARLSPGLSIYLDVLRFTASLAVFAAHAKLLLFGSWRLGPLFGQSREAVAVFFVLSGFTIRFVSVEKERDWRDYAVARVSRLYSVVLLAIVATWGLDRLGVHFNPHYYLSLSFFQPESVTAALRYLTFTNELWTTHVVFGTDEPYWSLGFEAAYYLVFGVAFYARGRLRAALLCGWFVLCGPKIAAYLPLWLIGVCAYEVQARWRSPWTKLQLCAALAGTFVAYAVIWALMAKATGNLYEQTSWFMIVRNLLYFHLVGVLVATNIVLFGQLVESWRRPKGLLVRIVRWLAGASFTLYLLHQPVMVFLSSLIPVEEMSVGAARIGCCTVTVITIVLLAELGERRKRWFSRWLCRLFGQQIAASSNPVKGHMTVKPSPVDLTLNP